MHGEVAADLLTVAEVAAFLNVRPRTIYELVRTKRIPSTLGGQLLFPREAPLQKLFSFTRTSDLRKHEIALGGHNVIKTGRVILDVRM
jgi:excisionase family DNA binding protein